MTKLPVDMRPRLTLEDYILFFTTRTGHGLTRDHLNQVANPPPARMPCPPLTPLPPVLVADRLHARLHQVPPPQQAGDRGGAQFAPPHAPAPLHRQHQRRRAPAGRCHGLGIGRRALHGGRHARHRGPRLVRVPRQLHPLRPRRSGRLLPHAPRHRPPRLRCRGARLPAEHTERLLAPSSSSPRGGEEEAGGEGPGEGGHEEEEEAHGGAAHAPVPREHGHPRLKEAWLARGRRYAIHGALPSSAARRRHGLRCLVCSSYY